MGPTTPDHTGLDRTSVGVARAAAQMARGCDRLRATVTSIARDATYVGIGLTILGVQRAQVLRRELLDR
jgi:hypothetical protein